LFQFVQVFYVISTTQSERDVLVTEAEPGHNFSWLDGCDLTAMS